MKYWKNWKEENLWIGIGFLICALLLTSCGVKYADLEVDLFKNTRLDTTAQTLPPATVVTNHVEIRETIKESQAKEVLESSQRGAGVDSSSLSEP